MNIILCKHTQRVGCLRSEWKTAPLACEYEKQTLEVFVKGEPHACILSVKFDCPVACRKCSLLAAAHDCESGFNIVWILC